MTKSSTAVNWGDEELNPEVPHGPESRERRRDPRVPTLIRVQPLDGTPAMIAQDLSVGGLGVTSRRPRWPGTLVPVRFRLPGERLAIRATCRVVDLVEVPAGTGLSLMFLGLAPEAERQLRRFVASRWIEEGQVPPGNGDVGYV